MSTKQSTIDYILDQLAPLETVTARKMFGEYALYFEGKVVALVCDNTLYVKITEPGKVFLKNDYVEGFPYPGAKAAMVMDGSMIEDGERLCELLKITADNLPLPKKKK